MALDKSILKAVRIVVCGFHYGKKMRSGVGETLQIMVPRAESESLCSVNTVSVITFRCAYTGKQGW